MLTIYVAGVLLVSGVGSIFMIALIEKEALDANGFVADTC